MEQTDVLIVGAGPIGIELAIALRREGIETLQIEAEMVGRTIHRLWPRMTRFLSAPDEIAIPGLPTETFSQDRLFGEEYLAYLRNLIGQFDLPIRLYERVTRIQPDVRGFTVTSQARRGQRRTRAQKVVVATGDMAFPRRMGVPGEDLPHVLHHYEDPHAFCGCDVMIVGGGNSAVEAAIRLHRAGARRILLSYRRDALDRDRISHKLYPILEPLIERDRVHFLGRALPERFTADSVVLAPTADDHEPTAGKHLTVDVDFVLLTIGFEADTRLLREAGVVFETPVSPPRLDEVTMETNVPGLYVAGTAAAGNQYGHAYFIETCHVHVGRIVNHILARRPPGPPG